MEVENREQTKGEMEVVRPKPNLRREGSRRPRANRRESDSETKPSAQGDSHASARLDPPGADGIPSGRKSVSGQAESGWRGRSTLITFRQPVLPQTPIRCMSGHPFLSPSNAYSGRALAEGHLTMTTKKPRGEYHTIFSGLTHRSNCSSLTSPNPIADSRSVKLFS